MNNKEFKKAVTKAVKEAKNTKAIEEEVSRILDLAGFQIYPSSANDDRVIANKLMLQLLDNNAKEAQTNAVAWTIGVVDELHSHVGEDGSFKDYDLYKGIKNTIRDKYKDITNIDPAPSYPVHAKLKYEEQIIMSTTQDELREQLASIEHERWADWQKYCHTIIRQTIQSGNSLEEVLERWDRQIKTPYMALSDSEQASDMEQVDRYWSLVEAYKDNACEEAFKRGYIAGSIDQLNKSEKK